MFENTKDGLPASPQLDKDVTVNMPRAVSLHAPEHSPQHVTQHATSHRCMRRYSFRLLYHIESLKNGLLSNVGIACQQHPEAAFDIIDSLVSNIYVSGNADVGIF